MIDQISDIEKPPIQIFRNPSNKIMRCSIGRHFQNYNIASQKGAFVLMIDSNTSDTDLLHYIIKGENLGVNLITINGREEISRFLFENDFVNGNLKRPNLIIIDPMCPEVGGFQLLERIRKDISYRYIPIAIYSGYDYKDFVAKAYQKGANYYLYKPLDYQNTVAVMRGLFSFHFGIKE